MQSHYFCSLPMHTEDFEIVSIGEPRAHKRKFVYILAFGVHGLLCKNNLEMRTLSFTAILRIKTKV